MSAPKVSLIFYHVEIHWSCLCVSKEKKKGSVRFLYLNMQNYSNRKKNLTGVIHSFKIIC